MSEDLFTIGQERVNLGENNSAYASNNSTYSSGNRPSQFYTSFLLTAQCPNIVKWIGPEPSQCSSSSVYSSIGYGGK